MKKNTKLLDFGVVSDSLVEVVDGFSTSNLATTATFEQATTFLIKRGKGNLIEGGARVSPGVSGHLSVDIKVHTISSKNFDEIVSQVTKTLSSTEVKKLSEYTRENKGRVNWFLGLFGIFSGGNCDKYKEETKFNTTVDDEKKVETVTQMFDMAEEECSVKGDFTIIGVGTGSEASVYVEIMTIETEDGRQKIQIVNDQAFAADLVTGSTEKVKLAPSTNDKLEIVGIT